MTKLVCGLFILENLENQTAVSAIDMSHIPLILSDTTNAITRVFILQYVFVHVHGYIGKIKLLTKLFLSYK